MGDVSRVSAKPFRESAPNRPGRSRQGSALAGFYAFPAGSSRSSSMTGTSEPFINRPVC